MHFADFHCDTISELFHRKQDITQTLRNNSLQLDADRLYHANYLLQHFAVFIDRKQYENPYETALDMLDYYQEQLSLCKDMLHPIYQAKDLDTSIATHKVGAIATIEEGGILDFNIERLDTLYEKGVRLLTLTWNYDNCIGSPSNLYYGQDVFPTIPNTSYGLTPFGIEVVRRCEELGILVDVSHLSDAGFVDAASCTTKPFVASHSSARALCPHVRNLSDDMIRTIADRGGLIGINFCPAFVEPAPSGVNPHIQWAPYGTIHAIVRHIRHVYNTGGLACLSLGSDFDGINRYLELDDVTCMPQLYEALKKDGFHESEIDAILYQNMIQFYRYSL